MNDDNQQPSQTFIISNAELQSTSGTNVAEINQTARGRGSHRGRGTTIRTRGGNSSRGRGSSARGRGTAARGRGTNPRGRGRSTNRARVATSANTSNQLALDVS